MVPSIDAVRLYLVAAVYTQLRVLRHYEIEMLDGGSGLITICVRHSPTSLLSKPRRGQALGRRAESRLHVRIPTYPLPGTGLGIGREGRRSASGTVINLGPFLIRVTLLSRC